MHTDKEKKLTRAQELFFMANEKHKELIRECLKEERDVIHLKRRSDIHQKLYDHIKRIVK